MILRSSFTLGTTERNSLPSSTPSARSMARHAAHEWSIAGSGIARSLRLGRLGRTKGYPIPRSARPVAATRAVSFVVVASRAHAGPFSLERIAPDPFDLFEAWLEEARATVGPDRADAMALATS